MRFDSLVRSAAQRSRRGLVVLLVSFPLASGLGTMADDADARRRRRHRGQPRRTLHQERNEAREQACIPSGQRCPSQKRRGKKGKKLSCTACCEGGSRTEADGKRYCGCQTDGGTCTTSSACCSGICDGTTCQAAHCSATSPCPQCQICNTSTSLCEPAADGTACDDGNACTQTDTCQGGVCVGSNPRFCPPPGITCHLQGTCDPATGLCSNPIAPTGTVCAGSGATTSICCNGTCWDGCCTADGEPGDCLAFVTSTTYTGDLGGLAGADAKCQQRATAGSLPGTYRAWLATGSGPDECPAMGRFRQSGQAYRRVDGELLASDWTHLVDDSDLAMPLNITELGIPLDSSSPWAWTSTTPQGFPGTKPAIISACDGFQDLDVDCQGWTKDDASDQGGVGLPAAVTCNRTGDTTNSCTDEHHLYCFQQS